VDAYQRDFIEFVLDNEALTFGKFTLKSGRVSPYFFNAGKFASGLSLARLGGFYADALLASGLPFDVLMGPAYKGIPLVATTVVALATRGHDVPYVFNRKEAKDHGEGGRFVGAQLAGQIVLVDDVITSGKAFREVLPLITEMGATVSGALVAIDRQERGRGDRSAIQEVEDDFGMRVTSVVKLGNIVDYLRDHGEYGPQLEAVEQYRSTFGVSSD
jgi:orotate phosphoribosyltransferase